jgi:hypothetical protein
VRRLKPDRANFLLKGNSNLYMALEYAVSSATQVERFKDASNRSDCSEYEVSTGILLFLTSNATRIRVALNMNGIPRPFYLAFMRAGCAMSEAPQ